MIEKTSSDGIKQRSCDSRMAGPETQVVMMTVMMMMTTIMMIIVMMMMMMIQEPVNTMVDSKEIPVKASPPREKSPSLPDAKTGHQGESGAGEESSVPPPDGGWGWAVVFASFMIHIIGENQN